MSPALLCSAMRTAATSPQVQHYLRPEEMRPFWEQAREAAAAAAAAGGSTDSGGAARAVSGGAPAQLYDTLVALGLLRR